MPVTQFILNEMSITLGPTQRERGGGRQREGDREGDRERETERMRWRGRQREIDREKGTEKR